MDERVVGGVAALIAYILWRRGVVQATWGALWGTSQRSITSTTSADVIHAYITSGAASDAAAKTANVANSLAPSPTPADVVGGGQDAVVADALPKALAMALQQHGGDLYQWCLQLVNNARQASGLGGAAYTARTAHDACGQLQLHSGVAPRGATVCFNDTPGSGLTSGHIGIANGGDSYSSVGIYHGSNLAVLPYLNNPNYAGYAL